MESLKQYVVTVSASAMLCALVNTITRKTPSEPMVKLLCGLVLLCTIIMPLKTMEVDDLFPDIVFPEADATDLTNEGERISNGFLQDHIKQETEEYIEQYADRLNILVKAEVGLKHDDTYLPEYVSISGIVPEEIKKILSEMITSDLNIPEENQIWTG